MTATQAERTVRPVSVRTRLGAGGRVVIPAEFREKLGLEVGAALILTCEDGGVVVTTLSERIRRAQKHVAERMIHTGVSMADELIAERRAEAARE